MTSLASHIAALVVSAIKGAPGQSQHAVFDVSGVDYCASTGISNTSLLSGLGIAPGNWIGESSLNIHATPFTPSDDVPTSNDVRPADAFVSRLSSEGFFRSIGWANII